MSDDKRDLGAAHVVPVRRFRKKPVEIEAVRTSDAMIGAAHVDEWLPSWLADAHARGTVLFLPNGVQISTLEGAMHAEPSDWIIRGVRGELYPCKPDIFEATYEALDA
jgi:hypothetical protein